MTEAKKRVRRTPAEARSLILEAAETRLQSDGPEGLKVKDVAAVAGVAHSTLLHHFGSAEGLRSALIAGMGNRLLEDILEIFKKDSAGTGENEVLLRVFEILSDKGHARLLAWMMLKGDQPNAYNAATDEQTHLLFHQLIEAIAEATILAGSDQSEQAWRRARQRARFSTMLAAVAAVGDGIAGPFLAGQIGLSEKEARGDFRDWFAGLLQAEFDSNQC
jgi:TetR/AcrR family transcriptional regulator, repressor for neighboring sulfatase